jgi:hypothetical protein
MNKRGTHVEVIVSFIIFIVFLVFLFTTVQSPLRKQDDKKGITDSIELGLKEMSSAEITTASIILESGGEACVTLDGTISNLGIGRNIVVKDYYGNTIPSSLNGDYLQINRVSPSDTFFKIYYSEEFNELGGGSGCLSQGYDLGFTKTGKYVFEEKFIELINMDYSILKSELKIPEGTEFGYGLILSDGTTHERAEAEVSTNIFITETPVEYVDLQGNILQGYIKVSIW